MSRIFGGRDPFDDPFFTPRPFGSLFGSSMFDANASSHIDKCKGPIIEEIDSDDENKEDVVEDGEKNRENASTKEIPLVQHPEDQTDDHDKIKSNSSWKEVSYRSDSESSDCKKLEGVRPQKGSVSFHRVTYGGINGAYYTAETARRTGRDGVVLEESKESNRTTRQATHRISKGIHEKGHSVMRKLNSDGKVDTIQTLHNLDEDELSSFERSWKGNADTHIPGWDYGFEFPSTTGGGGIRLTSWSGWEPPYREQFHRNAGFGADIDAGAHSNVERSKKVVTIPIE